MSELDKQGLTTLVQALHSRDTRETIAALDMLAQLERSDLVPDALLGDSRPKVVLEAIRVLRRDPRPSVRRRIQELSDHDSPEIRAASLRHAHASRFQTHVVTPHLADADENVRGAAQVLNLVRRASRGSGRARRSLERLSRTESNAVQVAIATRIAELRASGDLAINLANEGSREVRVSLAEGILQAPRDEHLPALIQLLADRKARPTARRALVLLGSSARDAVSKYLGNPRVHTQIRLHLPRTLCCFPEASNLDVLLNQLARETDDAISYKLLRALGSARNHHREYPLDAETLDACIEREIRKLRDHQRALGALQRRFDANSGGVPSELLISLLRDRCERALQRVFRALHVRNPDEDFEALYDGLTHADPMLRSASLEVVQNLVPSEWGEQLAAYVNPAPLDVDELETDTILAQLSGSPGVIGVFARELVHHLHAASTSHPSPTVIDQELAHVAQ